MKYLLPILLLFLTEITFATDYLAANVQEAITLLKKAQAGDKVLLKNGTYTNETVRFQNNNGREKSLVTFAAETPGKVFFEGSSTLAFDGTYLSVSGFTWRNGGGEIGKKSVIEIKGSHNLFSDCAIIEYNSIDTIDNKWLSIYGEYNTVSHCLLKDKRNLGATLTVWLTPGKEAHHTISYNYFNGRHNKPQADNGLESIRIGDSKTSFEHAHCVVALNRFENCDGEIEIISNKSCFNSYLHNTFYSSNGGLTLRHGNNCLVDGNSFEGAGKPLAYGVRFIGEGHAAINNFFHNLDAAGKETFRAPLSMVTGVVNTAINGYFQVRRAYVEGNYFLDCSTPNIRIGATPKRDGATLAPDTVTIINNVFVTTKNSAANLYEEVLRPGHASIQNNIIVGDVNPKLKGFTYYAAKSVTATKYALRDTKGVEIISLTKKVILPSGVHAGASWVKPAILKVIAKKFTMVTPEQVGPRWTSN